MSWESGAIFLFGCLALFFTYKLYRLTHDKAMIWLGIATFYGMAFRAMRILGLVEIAFSSKAMCVFWALFLVAIFSIYRSAHRILKSEDRG